VASLTDETTQPSREKLGDPRRPRGGRQSTAHGRNMRLSVILGLCLAVAAALALVVALTNGQTETPPATGAAALVPSDALLYVHLSTDRTRPAVRRALALLRRLPAFADLVASEDAKLTASLGAGLPSAIKPWLAKEAAFAVLNTRGSAAGTLVVIDVRNRARALAFLSGRGATPDGTYYGVGLLRQASGTELAFVRHYLVFGQRASVRASIDAATGRVRSLQGSSAFEQAAAGEPADRVLDAYVPAAGATRLLIPHGGLLGALGTLLDQPTLTGATVSLSPAGGGLKVRVHTALARMKGPGPTPFAPTLAATVPSGSTLLLIVKGLERSAPRILDAAAAVGVGGRIGPLLRRLGAGLASEGVKIGQITSIFSGETAVALAPAGPGRGPALVIVTRTSHEGATRRLLAQLELPLAQLFPPPSAGPGAVPEFGDVSIAGVTAHKLALAPGLELEYAVSHGLVVVSTSLRALGEVFGHVRPLVDEPRYRVALANGASQVTSLLFLDFSQLLSLGEQTGLMHGPQVAALRPDLEKIRAIGLDSTRGESDTTAELFFDIP
jgi:hypothetical protein